MKTTDKIIIIVYSLSAIICLIGTFWNRSQIILSLMSASLAIVSYFDLKKEMKK